MRSTAEDRNPAEVTSGLQARAQWTAVSSEMVNVLRWEGLQGEGSVDDRGVCGGRTGVISRLCHQMPDPSLPLEVVTDGQQQGRSKLSHRLDVTGHHTAPPLNT